MTTQHQMDVTSDIDRNETDDISNRASNINSPLDQLNPPKKSRYNDNTLTTPKIYRRGALVR